MTDVCVQCEREIERDLWDHDVWWTREKNGDAISVAVCFGSENFSKFLAVPDTSKPSIHTRAWPHHKPLQLGNKRIIKELQLIAAETA